SPGSSLASTVSGGSATAPPRLLLMRSIVLNVSPVRSQSEGIPMLASHTLSIRRLLPAFLILTFALPLLSACGYNTIPTLEEHAKAAWSEVLNQYQRRADLIPNLVATVKGYAAHEKEVLEGVVEARAKATQ